MSISTAFVARAQGLELTVPAAPERLHGNPTFTGYQARRSEYRGRVQGNASQLLGGRSLAPGFDLKGLSARADSKTPVTQVAHDASMVWEWAQALARLDGSARADALVPMASQALTFFYSEIYEIQHANLPAWEGEYLRIDKRPAAASEQLVWYEKDLVGVARAASTYDTTKIPLVGGPAAQANVVNVMPFLVGMQMNFMDIRREQLSRMNGKPDFQVYQSKVNACQRVLAEAANFAWLYGDTGAGLTGLMNNDNIAMIQIVGAWSGKTALQMLDDLQTMAQSIPNATQGQLGDYRNIRILLPPDQFDRANLAPVTSAGSISVIQYFEQMYKGVKIVKQYDLAAANSQLWIGGPQGLARDRAVITYMDGDDSADPMFTLPQMIEIPAPPRQDGLGETTFFHMRIGGMKLPDARRVRFAEGL